MNESAAHAVLLVRAAEGADAPPLLSEEDRRHASRAALELARWQSAERKTALLPETFLLRRAELLITKLAERQPATLRAARALQWPRWLGALPVAALALGLLSEQIADRSHVNLLAFPLLAIIAWNLAIYLALALHAMRPGQAALPRVSRWLSGGVARRVDSATWLLAFATDWLRRSATLYGARMARILHLGAALLALGAVAALYLRGIVFEYRVGWESTFLDADDVRRWLALLLGPASALTGIGLPTQAEIESLHFGATTSGGAAARWIHLYAVTVGLIVVLPRLVLAAAAGLRERYLRERLPVDLDEPHFRRLLSGICAEPVTLRVVPYSYAPDEAVLEGLRRLVQHLFGDDAGLLVAPVVGYGDEERAADGLVAGNPRVGLTAVLASLASTPEHEGHGTLLAALTRRLGRAPLLLIDESGYRRRLGAGGEARLAERREAWRAFGAAHGVQVVTLDLASPDASELARAEPAFSLRAGAAA